MDVLSQRVREGGRTSNVAVVLAVGVNRDGGDGAFRPYAPEGSWATMSAALPLVKG